MKFWPNLMTVKETHINAISHASNVMVINCVNRKLDMMEICIYAIIAIIFVWKNVASILAMEIARKG